MADFDQTGPIDPDWTAHLPSFSLSAPPKPQPNFFTSALSSGFHEALGNLGGTAQAIGTATGITPLADFGKSVAQSQAQQAAAAGRPDLEGKPFSSLEGFGYNLTKTLPTLGGAIGADLAAGPVGAAAFMFPQAVGGNVQTAQDASGGAPLSAGDAAKSLLLGAPEAAAMAVLPGGVKNILAKGAEGGFAKRAAFGALGLGAYQGVLGGAQEAVTQQAFTPDMPIADRARAVVNAALSGGIQGAVFGGTASALSRARSTVSDKDPANVTTGDLTGAVDNVVQPPTTPAAPLQIPSPERITPLPKVAGSPYTDTTNDDLLSVAAPLADKGDARTAAENIQHGLVQAEIARRTPPGLAAGEGELFTPEQMAQRQPQVDALKKTALDVAGAGDASPFFQNFNASNEPELVNSLNAAADTYGKKAPEWFKTLATKYGVVGESPAEQLVRLQDEQAKSMAARDAAMAAGKAQAVRATNQAVIELQPKIAAADKLVQTHLAADTMLEQQRPLPAPVADISGQLNLPGMPEAKIPVPGEAPAATPGTASEAQLSLLDPELQAIKANQFQDLVLSRFAPRVRAQVEPLVRSLPAANEPELINQLRQQHAALGGATPPGALGQLLDHFGVADREGVPIDLDAAKQALQDQYQAQLSRVSAELKAGRDGQANILFKKAQDFKNSTINDLDNLRQNHGLADDIGKPVPDIQVPDRVPPEMANRWRVLEQIKTESQSNVAQKAADTAQKAIEQRNPEAQAIMQLALNRYADESRPRITTERTGAVREPGAEGVDVRQPAENGGGVAEGNTQGNAAAQESGPRQGQTAETPSGGATPAGRDLTPAEQADSVARSMEQVGSNLGPGDIQNDEASASRAGGDAFRAGASRGENPFDQEKDPDKYQAWRDGWNTAQRPTHASARPALKPLPKPLDPATSRAKIEAAVAEGNLQPEKLAQAQQALVSRDPHAVVALENSWAKIEQLTGRPFNAAINPPDRPAPFSPPAPKSIVDDPNKSWAADVARPLAGDVIYAGDKYALLRGYNDLGEAVYVPADRNLGLRGGQDILSTQPGWLQGMDKERLAGIARKEVAADKAKFAANPEGPFKNAQAKVIGTPSADPGIVHYVGELLRTLGIDARVLVTDERDVRGAQGDKLGLNGPYQSARSTGIMGNVGEMRTFGPGLKDFYINVQGGHSDAMRIETASHEVGHVVFRTALRNAPLEVQKAITASFEDFYKKSQGMRAQDIIKATRNRVTSSYLIDNAAPGSYETNAYRDYFTRKEEWFADQVSRWSTTADKPRNIVEQFFHAVGMKMRELLTSITGKSFLPDATVKSFLDKVAASAGEQPMTPRGGEAIPTTHDTGPRSPQETDGTLQAAIGNLEPIKQKIQETLEDKRVAAVPWMRRMAMGWMPLSDIDRTSRGILNSTTRFSADTRDRQIFTDAKNKPDVISSAAAVNLKPEAKEAVNNLLAKMNDGSGLDPRKTWAQHPDLHERPDAAMLAKKLQVMQGDLDRVQRAGGRQALDGVLQMMQTGAYQDMATLMHTVGEAWAARGVRFEGHGANPDEIYRGMTGEAGHDSPTATNAYYKSAAIDRRNGIQKYIDQKTAEASAAGLRPPGDLEALKSFVGLHDQVVSQAAKGTYSPLGRGDGNYFVSGKLSLGDDKLPKPAAVAALQSMLEKEGFHDIGVFHDTGDNTIMSRVESMAKMERLRDQFSKLEQAGHMLPGGTKAGYPERLDTMSGLGAKYQAIVEMGRSIISNTEGLDPKVADAISRQFVARAMDMIPDNSPLANMEARKYSSGFNKDMIATAVKSKMGRNYTSTAVGMRGRVAATREAMRQEIQDLKGQSGPNAVKAQDIANELWLRESQQASRIPNSVFDTMAELMHTLTIGFNPPYVLTMTSQIPTLSLPELAKKFGYAKSALGLANAASRSFAAMKAIMTGPDWATAGVRETTLRKAGISEKDIGTLMRLDNAGSLNTGTYTAQQAGLAEGEGASKYKKMANAMGTYAEMFPRIITALAAGDLHDARPVKGWTRDQTVQQMVDNSQFNWGAGQSGRMQGKAGPLGQFSRVAFQFTNFHTKMLGKLYTEMHDVLGQSGPEARKEAGVWLAGHLIAMTAIAGTLGIPAMGAIAGLTDKLAGTLTGRDDIDVEGIYRTWLASTFGPGAADVIAKGLPRGMGINLSHLGEGDILPFSGILRDKRKFEDASRDWFKQMAGSAVGEAGNMYLAGRDMLNGDYLRAAVKVLPEGFKGLSEGYFFYKNGYIDKNGTKYPVQPGAMDILTAALGLDPADLAQYDEANRIRMGLVAERQYREQNIETHLLRGIQTGDPNVGAWVNQAVEYQTEHPGLAGPLSALQRTLMANSKKSATAGALNTPLGVSPFDASLQSRTGFLTPQ